MASTCSDQWVWPSSLVNTYLEVGQRVAVVGMRRRAIWDSPDGLATLGPAHFGWPDFPFRPIEELLA